MNGDPYPMIGPFPAGTIFVGSTAWLAAADAESVVEVIASPAAALTALRSEAGTGEPLLPARLVVLPIEVFGTDGRDDAVEAWLIAAGDLRTSLLPVLLHQDLSGQTLVRFFRAGLFDALDLPVDRQAWLNVLVRAERRREVREQGRRILASGERTQDALRSQRRQLGREAVGTADDLLKAQASLEEANLRLTDAMSELSLLYRFGRQLSTARNWDDVLREILQSLADFVGAGGAALVLRSAPEGGFAPRQTWQWEESAWDKVLVSLHDQVDGAVAESIMAPGVFSVDPSGRTGDTPRRIIAQPLEHQDLCLGYLMLLFASGRQREEAAERYLPFLQAVQVVLAEEVAGAQLVDRIRDIGNFNARVLETVSSAIWVLDENGHSVYVNRAAQALLTGREPEGEVPGDFLFQVGRGRRLEPVTLETELPELLRDGRLLLDGRDGPLLDFLRGRPDGSFRGEGQVVAAGQEHVPVLVQTSLMAGRGHDRNWLVIVAEDLRESRILEAERLRSDRLEGLVEMSATLAHEIRNPLMGLSAQAELLAEHLPADDARYRYLDVITREVERIDATITGMLNFVRPYEPVREPTDLSELAADAVELSRARAEGAKVELAPLATPGATVSLEADAAQLKQVLLNLLINAVDAAGPHGRVAMSVAEGPVALIDAGRGTRQSVPGLICEVRNTGPAIEEADRARIFRPFFTTKSSGTGLGLSICHKIVSAHGGEITADRERDETVFRVLLPAFAATTNRELEEEA